MASDGEVRAAHADPDNRRLIASVFQKFGVCDPDGSLALEVVWKCLRKHDATLGKFTTSLHRFARWKCLNELKRKKRWGEPREIQDRGSSHDFSMVYVNDYLDMVGEGEREVLVDRCLEGRTFEEIGRKFGCSATTARRRYLRAANSLRERLINECD